ncbi:hypothetical protein D083_4391 [Dickeya solani RNS 08.23.3.1.A]|nr:hypothetical protein D083_4391 [Dickeya solani RNS 08.23.3.1.A]
MKCIESEHVLPLDCKQPYYRFTCRLGAGRDGEYRRRAPNKTAPAVLTPVTEYNRQGS